MSTKSFLLSIIGMLTSLSMIGLLSLSPEPVVVETNLEKLPLDIGRYWGVEDAFPESVYQELNADKHLYRHYQAEDGGMLDLYIGYYGTAKGGRTGHNPNACLPGAGWAIIDTRKINIRQPSHTMDAEVNYVRAHRDGVNTVMVHWYQTAGATVVSTGFRKNIEKFFGRLFHNRNDGAFVQVTTQVPDELIGAAEVEVADFAGLVLQRLPNYWPVEE